MVKTFLIVLLNDRTDFVVVMNLENNMSCEISVIWIEVVSILQPLFFVVTN